ncbi:fumarate hydratase class II [Bradyrhizobium sp. i1.4.4]
MAKTARSKTARSKTARPASRTETDSFGPIEVPADRYWGAQTERSRQNFRIGIDRMPIELVHALGIVKLAAAQSNLALGLLDQRRANAIIRAAREVIEGKLDDHFPLVVWQTGSGTQSNMNLNEVIANRANELLGGELGAKKPVHPNDHVNMSQSSNDSFPTAMHIAAASRINADLVPALGELLRALRKKEKEFAKIVKIGRTHTQDATPLTLGQEFFRLRRAGRKRHRPPQGRGEGPLSAGPGRHRRRHRPQLQAALRKTVRKARYWDYEAALHQRRQQIRGAGLERRLCAGARRHQFRRDRPVQDRQRHPPARIGPALGPRRADPAGERAGLLDHARQGQPDAVRGDDDGVLPGVRQSHCDHSRRQPGPFRAQRLQARARLHNMLHSIRLMADAARSFTEHCVSGIRADEKRIRELMQRSLMLVTALAPKIGYDNAAKVAKTAHANGTTLKEEALRLGFVSADEFDRLVQPEKMTRPG